MNQTKHPYFFYKNTFIFKNKNTPMGKQSVIFSIHIKVVLFSFYLFQNIEQTFSMMTLKCKLLIQNDNQNFHFQIKNLYNAKTYIYYQK